jgi:hypothetical protein
MSPTPVRVHFHDIDVATFHDDRDTQFRIAARFGRWAT